MTPQTHALSTDEQNALRHATEHVITYRNDLPHRSIPPKFDAAEGMRRFWFDLPEEGSSPTEIIDHMVREGDEGLMQLSSPGFFGYVIGASHPSGIAADILTSGWAQVTGYSEPTPTTAAMERAVCDWVIKLLNLPDECGAGITTGATLANTVGTITARNSLLRRANWDVEADGLFGAPEVHVVIGAEAHSAPLAALQYAGLGSKRVHTVPVDDQGRIDVTAYREVMEELSGPILVILQAGHINSGAFDPFEPLIEIARQKQAWVHVDGAFGLWVNAVPELADRLAGVEQADSWAVDLHKWLNAPYDAGMVITRNRPDLVRSMSAKGAYLPETGAAWDPNDTVMELSRRGRGVPSYAILRTLGQKGLREMIARHCGLASRIAKELSDVPGITVLNEVHCNQVAVVFGEDGPSDQNTNDVLERVQKKGRCYPSHGAWKGRDILRISVTGHATEDTHADMLVEDIREAWQQVQNAL